MNEIDDLKTKRKQPQSEISKLFLDLNTPTRKTIGLFYSTFIFVEFTDHQFHSFNEMSIRGKFLLSLDKNPYTCRSHVSIQKSASTKR